MPLFGIIWALICGTQALLGNASWLTALWGPARSDAQPPAAAVQRDRGPVAGSLLEGAASDDVLTVQAETVAPQWRSGMTAAARGTTKRLRQLQSQWLGPFATTSAIDARNGFDLCHPDAAAGDKWNNDAPVPAELTRSQGGGGGDRVPGASLVPSQWLSMGTSWLFGRPEDDRANGDIAIRERADVIALGDVAPYEVTARNVAIASFFDRSQAELLATRLRDLVNRADFDATSLQPGRRSGRPAIYTGDRLLFPIAEVVTQRLRRDPDLVAVEWTNHLREAYGAQPLSLVEGQMKMYQLQSTDNAIRGLASWYGPQFHGRLSANGEVFSQYAMTAAHKTLPFGTFLLVENEVSGDRAIVRVNDRGPYIEPRVLDLSRKAALCLNSFDDGVVPIRATVLQSPSQPSLNVL